MEWASISRFLQRKPCPSRLSMLKKTNYQCTPLRICVCSSIVKKVPDVKSEPNEKGEKIVDPIPSKERFLLLRLQAPVDHTRRHVVRPLKFPPLMGAQPYSAFLRLRQSF